METKASYLKPLAEEDEEDGEEAWACMYMSSHASYFGLKRAIRPNEPHLAIGKDPTRNALHNSGASFSVDPALPPGLDLDECSGIITGTPTTLAKEAMYV